MDPTKRTKNRPGKKAKLKISRIVGGFPLLVFSFQSPRPPPRGPFQKKKFQRGQKTEKGSRFFVEKKKKKKKKTTPERGAPFPKNGAAVENPQFGFPPGPLFFRGGKKLEKQNFGGAFFQTPN